MTSSIEEYILQKNKHVHNDNNDIVSIKNDIKKIFLFIHKIVSNSEINKNIPEEKNENLKILIQENKEKIDQLFEKTSNINEFNLILESIQQQIREFPKFINKEFNDLKYIFISEDLPNLVIQKEIPPEVQNELIRLSNLIDSSVINLNKEIDIADKNINKAQIEIEKIKNDSTNNDKDIEQLKKNITEIQKTLKDIQSNLTKNNVSINTLTANLKITNDNLNKTKSDVSILQNDVSILKIDNKTLLNNVTNIQSSFVNLANRNVDTRNLADKLKITLDKTNENIDNNIIPNIYQLQKFLLETRKETAFNIDIVQKNLDNSNSILEKSIDNLSNILKIDINSKINNLQLNLDNSNENLTNKINTGLNTLSLNTNSKINIVQNDIDDLRSSLFDTSNDISIIYKEENKSNTRTIYFKNADIDNITAQEFTLLSDKKLKKNIQPYIYNNNLLKLEAKKYEWINDSKKDTGFIAQEVQKLYPDYIKEKNGILSVNYVKFIPLIIEEIKQQKKEINYLKNIILLLSLPIIYSLIKNN